ncbi:MAG: MATE family efflux transporter [Faecalibacterium sp.]
MIKDLTKGNAQSTLIRFTLPMFVGVIFQQLYNIADSVIAGKFAGEDALAAVGSATSICTLFLAVSIGSQIGCSVVVSRAFGAQKLEETRTAISTALLAAAGVTVFLTTFGLLFSGTLLNLIQTPEAIFADAQLYLIIYSCGFGFLYLYNIATGIFNSLGDSKTPLLFLIGSSLSNIFLDWLFVAIFTWGVAGVAWATFVAQGAACILSLLVLRVRLRILKTDKPAARFSLPMLRQIFNIAGPSALQQGFISIGDMCIQSFVNPFGTSVIAGYVAAIRLNTFTTASFVTLGNGVSNFTAQNLGANKPERVRQGWQGGMKLSVCIGTVFFIAYYFFGSVFLSLFLEDATNAEALQTGLNFFHTVTPFYYVICIKLVSDGVLRGSASMKLFTIGTFSDLISRVVLARVFSLLWGVNGIWFAWPIGWLIGAVFSGGFYLSGKWRKNIPNTTISKTTASDPA